MTDNTDNNTEMSKVERAAAIDRAFRLYEVAKQAVARAQEEERDALLFLAQAAGEKTFGHRGKLYQIRERKARKGGEKTVSLCELSRSPAQWHAEARERKLEEAQRMDELLHAEELPEEAATASHTGDGEKTPYSNERGYTVADEGGLPAKTQPKGSVSTDSLFPSKEEGTSLAASGTGDDIHVLD